MSYNNVGVFYDSDTIRFHIKLFKKISLIDTCKIFDNFESFVTNNLPCKISILHVPYPFQQSFVEQVKILQQKSTHVYIIATEVHPEIVAFIKECDFSNITYYICGMLNFELSFAQVKQYLDWFETTSDFYKNWLPEILSRLNPFENKSKSFDILLGRKKLHRDQIFIHYAMGPDIGEIKYFNDTKTELNNSEKWIWEGRGLKVDKTINWTIDKINYYGYTMSLSQVIPIDIYNRTAYTVIAETCFHDNFSFFTEKTAKPIIGKRLFVMFAGRHYLKNLRTLGFKTFDGIIDETYDDETDSLQRWKLAYEQMIWLSKQPQENILEKIRPIVEHNFMHMMTTNWAEDFRVEFEQDVVRAIAG
jgi:hypothetical protein